MAASLINKIPVISIPCIGKVQLTWANIFKIAALVVGIICLIIAGVACKDNTAMYVVGGVGVLFILLALVVSVVQYFRNRANAQPAQVEGSESDSAREGVPADPRSAVRPTLPISEPNRAQASGSHASRASDKRRAKKRKGVEASAEPALPISEPNRAQASRSHASRASDRGERRAKKRKGVEASAEPALPISEPNRAQASRSHASRASDRGERRAKKRKGVEASAEPALPISEPNRAQASRSHASRASDREERRAKKRKGVEARAEPAQHMTNRSRSGEAPPRAKGPPEPPSASPASNRGKAVNAGQQAQLEGRRNYPDRAESHTRLSPFEDELWLISLEAAKRAKGPPEPPSVAPASNRGKAVDAGQQAQLERMKNYPNRAESHTRLSPFEDELWLISLEAAKRAKGAAGPASASPASNRGKAIDAEQQAQLERTFNYPNEAGSHTRLSPVVGRRAAELQAVKQKMRATPILKELEKAIYKGELIHLVDPKKREAADRFAKGLFLPYISRYAEAGVTEENIVEWLPEEDHKLPTSNKTFVYAVINEWNTWRVTIHVLGHHRVQCHVKYGGYLPPYVVAYHEVMHAEETPKLVPESFQKEDGGELLTTIKTIILQDLVYKHTEGLSEEACVDYGKFVTIRGKSIPLGKFANFYRRLEQEKGALYSALISDESIAFLSSSA